MLCHARFDKGGSHGGKFREEYFVGELSYVWSQNRPVDGSVVDTRGLFVYFGFSRFSFSFDFWIRFFKDLREQDPDSIGGGREFIKAFTNVLSACQNYDDKLRDLRVDLWQHG